MTEQCIAQTLTTWCGGVCGENQACVTYPQPAVCNATLDKGGKCATKSVNKCSFECFNTIDRDDGGFYFVISSDSSNHKDYSTTTNSGVTRLDRLTLPATTSIVFIVSGTQYFEFYYTSGTPVESIDFASGFLKDQVQVTNVSLCNFDFSKGMEPLTTILPPKVSVLDLSHNALEELPNGFSNLSSLSQFYALHNNIKVVDISTPMPSITHINVFANKLSAFEGNFPNVENLFLEHNNFAQIPASVYECTKLKKLRLTANPLVSPLVTQRQFNQLQDIDEVKLDGIDQTNFKCDGGTVRKMQGIKFCVVPDSVVVTSAPPMTSKPQVTTSSPPNITSGPHQASTRESSNNGVIVGLVSAGVVVVLSIMIIFWWKQRKSAANKRDIDDDRYATHPTTTTESMTSGPRSAASALLGDEDFVARNISKDSLTDIRELGSGAFGTVWLVQHSSGRLLASKRLINASAKTENGTALDRFIAEIKLNAKLSHKNVIQLFGIAWTSATDVQALFEFAPRGDLTLWLQRPFTSREWTLEKLQIAMNVIEALAYVHSFAPPLVHRDLKSRNVLLMDDMTAKLCDFGVSRFQSANATMTSGVGTMRWLAPEVIQGDTDYTSKADIYSFGVVLSELDTHQLPYVDVVGSEGNKLPEVALVHRVGMGVLSPSFRPSCPQNVLTLARWCLAYNPADRPTALETAHALRKITRDCPQSC